jgi:hypothetical protein
VYWDLAQDAQRRRLSPWPNQQAALNEWLAGTKSELKDRPAYRTTLGIIQTYYAETVGDRELEALCKEALALYDSRYENNDVRLSRTGVQDYLAQRDQRFR